MSLLYKFKSAWKEIYPLLESLQAANHRLLFVFDGKPPAEKEEEVRERATARQDAAAQAEVLRGQLATSTFGAREREILQMSVARLEQAGWHMTRDIRHAFQDGLWERKIPYVKGNGEADSVLTDLVGAGKLDVIISTDMDFLLSGVPRLWIPLRKAGVDGFEEISLEDVMDGEGLSKEGLLDAGILCGVEPLRGQLSVNAHTAFSWIRYYESLEGVLGSNVRESQLECLRGNPERLAAVRRHFQPQTPWEARIRPDHLERFRAELDAF